MFGQISNDEANGQDDFERFDEGDLEVSEMVQEAMDCPEVILAESDIDSDDASVCSSTDYDSNGHQQPSV